MKIITLVVTWMMSFTRYYLGTDVGSANTALPATTLENMRYCHYLCDKSE